MGLDIWFKEDVKRILAAIYETMNASLDASPYAVNEAYQYQYQRGFVDALRSIAISFGVVPPINIKYQEEGRGTENENHKNCCCYQ